MSYRIGSFNMFKFSFQSNSEIKKDMRTIAQIIREQDFDIIALQEVYSIEALKLLIAYLGTLEWDYAWDSPRSYSSVSAEGYGFIWNKRRMRLSSIIQPDGTKKFFQPHVYNQYRVDKSIGQRHLIRNPYYGRFEPLDGSFCEIRLINTHIMFAKGNHSDDNASDIFNLGAVTMRKLEFKILTESLYNTIADKRYGNNRPAYTIILGDYNLNHPKSVANGAYLDETVLICDNGNVKRLITIQDQLTTLKAANQSQNTGFSYWANNYDHFTFDADRFYSVKTEAHRIDSVKGYCKDDYELHRRTISDHVPVVMTMDLK